MSVWGFFRSLMYVSMKRNTKKIDTETDKHGWQPRKGRPAPKRTRNKRERAAPFMNGSTKIILEWQDIRASQRRFVAIISVIKAQNRTKGIGRECLRLRRSERSMKLTATNGTRIRGCPLCWKDSQCNTDRQLGCHEGARLINVT
jgi:hypothetical protein